MKSLLALSIVLVPCLALAENAQPLLFSEPALGKTQIVFSYAGDLWSVPRAGGDALRLTAGPGIESNPILSPDGSEVAFSGEYDGNRDVYVVSVNGGVPRRLTFHPGSDTPVGWTPDGKSILFRSNRESYSRFSKLFSIPAAGGFPESIPLPSGWSGAFSSDQTRLAYMPITPANGIWKRYRGGRTTPIWIARLSDSSVEKIPNTNCNDSNPMWVAGKVVFLSDRDGPITLFSYDPASRKVEQILRNTGLDLKWASAFGENVAYEQFGAIYLFDLKSGKSKRVEIHLAADIADVRPSMQKVGSKIVNARISPTGARAVFEARGEIFTVPAEKGDVRDLTNTSGVAERDPSWSPDGKQIAYFSDESGEYQLHLCPQSGLGTVTKISLGDPPAFFYEPAWSADSKKIAYTDNRLNAWYIDLEKKQPVLIDTDTYQTPFRDLSPTWSPDGKWIAYNKILKNHLRAVFVYSLDSGKSTQITDGFSDANYAQWDKNGKYLYFTASTNRGLSTSWLDMSSIDRKATRSVYVVVLRKEDASPTAPESDDEKPADASKKDGKDKDTDKDTAKEKDKEKDKDKEPVTVRIDFDNIDQRILALPIAERDYTGLLAGKTGILYLVEAGDVLDTLRDQAGDTIQKFDLKSRKTEKIVEGVKTFDLSGDGEKMLFQQGGKWFIAASGAAPKPGDGLLKTDAMEMHVDPRAEWRQIYHEIWRIERDFFYDPNAHGLNLKAAAEKYRPYAENIASREDLNYLFEEMLGELSVGHLFVGGGAYPEVKKVPGGLLGADYKIENGRYRFARVYRGENWNPTLKAPLTQPGVNVAAGEYLLAVNGRDLQPPDSVYAFFEGTADKSVVIRVGPDPSGANSREVTVVPVADEFNLRNRAWMDDNRRKVDQLSGGRLAYVYLPNTAGQGYANFNRYYFAQIGKEGAVIDERFNGGGDIADYIIDYLKRPQTNFFMTRYGSEFTTPQNQIFGPKAMIINEYAGSGGDAMPWLFRNQKVGKLVGKRTWGGLVGIFGFPELIDGGFVTAPNLAFYNLSKEWDVENHGVPPDIEVEYDPALVRQGHDPQLEKAVEVLLQELKEHPLPKYEKPPFPNYHKATQ
ncbi:MAG TPA: PDZ domain-containing protein [Bryobacteraceae bacterium]|nr:PDZ domain-containing protein [Bryobacteraceae bacterium]